MRLFRERSARTSRMQIASKLSPVAILIFVAASVAASYAATNDVLPNTSLTPGAISVTDAAAICVPGYARAVRPRGALWRRLKNAAYNEYGLPRGKRSYVDAAGKRHPAYEVDHLISLELGGSPTDLRNLWPEPIDSARRKDRVENALHERVCSGHESLAQAQRDIARNWLTALRSTP